MGLGLRSTRPPTSPEGTHRRNEIFKMMPAAQSAAEKPGSPAREQDPLYRDIPRPNDDPDFLFDETLGDLTSFFQSQPDMNRSFASSSLYQRPLALQPLETGPALEQCSLIDAIAELEMPSPPPSPVPSIAPLPALQPVPLSLMSILEPKPAPMPPSAPIRPMVPVYMPNGEEQPMFYNQPQPPNQLTCFCCYEGIQNQIYRQMPPEVYHNYVYCSSFSVQWNYEPLMNTPYAGLPIPYNHGFHLNSTIYSTSHEESVPEQQFQPEFYHDYSESL